MNKPRILIVEDRHDWQNILIRSLRVWDCDIDIAGRYEEALHLLEHHPYQVAIIDPVLDNTNRFNRDGLRVLGEIHARFPATHMVVVSGSITDTVLRGNHDLPPHLPMFEKQNWDKEGFRQLIYSLLNTYPVLNRDGLNRVNFRLTTQDMPPIPSEGERVGVPRVLIIEDRPDWQIILARAIDEEGWFWRIASHADEALDMLQYDATAFNVLLLDLRLGDAEIPLQQGAGWALLDYLSNVRGRVKIIIVSGEASRSDVARLFMNYQIDGFIDKDTFYKHELTNHIRKLTSGPRLYIQTLGDFRMLRGNEPITHFPDIRAEYLLKFLITCYNEVAPTDEILDAVFPDVPRYEARLHLPEILLMAAQVLEPDIMRPEDSSYILEAPGGFRLDFKRNVTADFDRLERILEEGKAYQDERAFASAIKTYEAALPLYQGEYLPDDRHETWTITMRGYLQTRFARILRNLSDLYARDGRLDDAIRTVELCLLHDGYSESVYRRLMRLHGCQGDTKGALNAYRTLEKLFREFFGEEPGEETRALRDSIERGEKIPCVEVR